MKRVLAALGAATVTLLMTTPAFAQDTVDATGPAGCLTTGSPTDVVSIDFNRTDATPVRGYSVTFTLSAELTLSDPDSTVSIVESNYLSDVGGTSFQILGNGGGSYTVDCVILGTPCGATGNGQLFTVEVTGVSDGAATLTVNSVTVRDCSNAPVTGSAGTAAAVTVDTTAPSTVTAVSSAQVKNGILTAGVTEIDLSWTSSVSGDVANVVVYRQGFGDYPEYDAGGVPTVPVGDPTGSGWTSVATLGAGATSFTDTPPTRDFWYYIVVVDDVCGNVSLSSAISVDSVRSTTGTLNYHLGDVTDGLTAGDGDNAVVLADVSTLGASYGLSGAPVAAVNYLDVGPTADFSVDALPTTDDALNFEDLVVFAINFGQVSRSVAPVASADRPVLGTDIEHSDGEVTVHLRLEGNSSTVKGIHSEIAFDRERLTLIGVDQGELLSRQAAPVFFKSLDSKRGVIVDAAVLGRDLVVDGSGEVATLTFRVRGDAMPKLVVADLRDRANLRVGVGGTTAGDALTLSGARPNPFGASTAIAFRIADSEPVSVRVYDIGGRMIRSLVDGTLPAGEHSVSWNGRDTEGRAVAPGVYFYTFRAGDHRETHKLFRYVR